MIDCGGGTTIDVAVQHISRSDKNAIIITDAEDRCRTYTENAFFIGLKGASFDHFDPTIISQYSQRNQVIVFDGKKVNRVDELGKIVK
jgi:hypothetical protein